MPSTQSARTRRRRTGLGRVLPAGLLIAAVAIAAALGQRSPAPSASPVPPTSSSSITGPPADAPRPDPGGPLGEADGAVPDDATVFDDRLPAVANLDPELLDALREAAVDAAADGVEFHLDSGWRSPAYQARLLREAVVRYGSAERAARWVASPETSAHVSGDAVDIGGADARAWLSSHGAGYGLCQTYGNEPWHYERRPDAGRSGCPAMYPDPTHDPRLMP